MSCMEADATVRAAWIPLGRAASAPDGVPTYAPKAPGGMRALTLLAAVNGCEEV